MLQVLPAEKSESALCPRGAFKESLLFVEADGVNRQPSFPSHLPYLDAALRHIPKAYTLESTPESRPKRFCRLQKRDLLPAVAGAYAK